VPEYKILNIRDNRLLGRREVELEIRYDGSGVPSRQEVRQWVANQLGVSLDTTYVVKIRPYFGQNRAVAFVDVYDTPELARKVLPLHIYARNLGPEGKKLLEEYNRQLKERRERKKRKRKK